MGVTSSERTRDSLAPSHPSANLPSPKEEQVAKLRKNKAGPARRHVEWSPWNTHVRAHGHATDLTTSKNQPKCVSVGSASRASWGGQPQTGLPRMHIRGMVASLSVMHPDQPYCQGTAHLHTERPESANWHCHVEQPWWCHWLDCNDGTHGQKGGIPCQGGVGRSL